MMNDVYVQSERLRTHQLHILEMLRYFDGICKKNEIPYFIVGGTALGAIRHRGFIPWDDDADVGIPRPHYERFEKIMLLEKHGLFTFAFISDRPVLNAMGEKKASLDIFPLDGVPANYFLRKLQSIAANLYHLSVYQRIPKNRGKWAAMVVGIALKCTPRYVFSLLGKISKRFMMLWSYEESLSIANIFGMAGYSREIMPRNYLGVAKPFEFEGSIFPGPAKPHEYLTHLYRDYMRLPPVAARKPMHGDFE
jgi:lipopolysaccharide cholinephosphotransferase